MIKLILTIVYSLYALLYIFQDSIILFYSTDPKVAYYMKPIISFFSIYWVVDSVQFTGSVFYKSIGFGSWVIKWFTFCFYAIGLTAMWFLTFTLETKIMSAWVGNFLGSVFLNIIYYRKWQEIDIAEVTRELNAKVSVEERAHSVKLTQKEREMEMDEL